MKVSARLLGVSGTAAYVAVSNPFSGRRSCHNLWCLPLNGSPADGRARVGLEIPLDQCRRIAREAGAK